MVCCKVKKVSQKSEMCKVSAMYLEFEPRIARERFVAVRHSQKHIIYALAASWTFTAVPK